MGSRPSSCPVSSAAATFAVVRSVSPATRSDAGTNGVGANDFAM